MPSAVAALTDLGFGEATAHWFASAFPEPTRVQREGWRAIARGEHALLLAPTGSGKTLAAFLWCLDALHHRVPPDAARGVRVVYVSPLKALVYDIERNLRAPLAGIRHTAAMRGIPVREVGVAVRTGDTPARERESHRRRPPDLLVTTPESLYLLLSSRAAEGLRTVRHVIVDEVHSLAPTKRGAHLALTLERLSALADEEPQRIGLSATVRPPEEAARYLGGDRPVTVVDAGERPRLDLRVVVPVPDMEAPDSHPEPPRQQTAGSGAATSAGDDPSEPEGPLLASLPGDPAATAAARALRFGMWPRIYPPLVDLIRRHRSTIVFVNSRILCERLVQRLNDLAGETLVHAHHGSLSHARRAEVEEGLKGGQVRGIVATSSLELGIDMGAVDLVVLVESPGAVARGLQRTGRAGHQVGGTSTARLFPKHRGDLLEAAVVARAMQTADIESLRVPRACLDVLAQHVVSACVQGPTTTAALERLVRRAYSYRDLPREALVAVLDMLTGRYPSDAFADLRPSLNWDRARDRLEARRHARGLVAMNPGTIPDRGAYAVQLGHGGPRVGELDEEMVFETRRGETFVLGASTWRVIEVERDRVIVEPAPGEPGKLPFWKGPGPGRPLELGRAVGAFARTLAALRPDEARRFALAESPLDDFAAENLCRYVAEQREATGEVPSDRTVVIERFRDDLGDWRVVILSPFGARVHAPWALAVEAALGRTAGFAVQALWSDDGIALRFGDGAEPPAAGALVPRLDEVEDLVLEGLRSSAVLAATFRECAGRALLLPRRRPKARSPLWAQRRKAELLFAAASRHPSFPVVLEAYRECLQDIFDLPALAELLGAIERREVRIREVETDRASPFARSLLFAYTAAHVYEQDAPLAERRAAAVQLDRALLRELCGGDEALRDLIDPEALALLESELTGLAPERRARDLDALHDLLRRLGDLDEAELAARATGDIGDWLASLADQRRAAPVRVAGGRRWIAVEDAALYRDALGVVPPSGLPTDLLGPIEGALERLVLRFARGRGPFTASALALRYRLPAGAVEPLLDGLAARGQLAAGALRPGGSGREWCCPEVLRRLRRLTLAKLRGEVAAVDASVLASFLLRWHGLVDADEEAGERGSEGSGGEGSDLGREGGSAQWLLGAADANAGREDEGGAPPVRGTERLREAIEQLEGLALPFSALEEHILPARVPGYRGAWLDALGSRGEVVWVGRGALGPRDGRIALYTRERASLLLDPPPAPDAGPAAAPEGEGSAARGAAVAPSRATPPPATASPSAPSAPSAPGPAPAPTAMPAPTAAPGSPPGLSPLAVRLYERLRARGASFFAELCREAVDLEPRSEGVREALWDLAWAGLVTNDSFQPLRSVLGGRGGSRVSPLRGRPGRRPTARPRLALEGGRWFAVASLVDPRVEPTARAHARTLALLDRYGVVSRSAVLAEGLPGGFAAVYPVLQALEDRGLARRGHFVDGLDGAQFALPGAVDRLRALRDPGTREAVVLSVVDPANPFGTLLPWPGGGPTDDQASQAEESASGGRGLPRRSPGALVVVVDGAPVLVLERGRSSLVTLPAATEPARLDRALLALGRHAERRGHALEVERIDQAPARESPLAPALRRHGFRADYRALVLEPWAGRTDSNAADGSRGRDRGHDDRGSAGGAGGGPSADGRAPEA